MKWRRSYPLAWLAIALAVPIGCVQPKPEPSRPPSPTAAIDGTYAGTANGSCGASQPASMELRDGRFILNVATGLRLQGRAERNGTLAASQVADDGREVNFTGQIDGRLVRGGSYNGRCAFAFELSRTS